MISVITPTYNSEKYIRKTIQSLKNQTNKDFEHIVVDGGSKDRTKVICEEEGISKFYLLESSSMYEAIDFGFRQSSGDVLCWLNSDDLFLSDTIQFVENYFKLNKEKNIIAGDTIYIDENGNDMYKYRFPYIPLKLFKSFGTLYLCQPSVFWRRKIYFDNDGLNLSYKLTADRDFIFRVVDKNTLIYVNKVLSRFRLHSENLSKLKADIAEKENQAINKSLNVGPTSAIKKILSLAGHLYIKLNNPTMIIWKTKRFFNLIT